MFDEKHYRRVEEAFLLEFGLKKEDLKPFQWQAGRSMIKRLFIEGFLIRDIIDSMEEAHEKKKWPIGTGVWARIRDVCYKNRIEQKKVNNIVIDSHLTKAF